MLNNIKIENSGLSIPSSQRALIDKLHKPDPLLQTTVALNGMQLMNDSNIKLMNSVEVSYMSLSYGLDKVKPELVHGALVIGLSALLPTYIKGDKAACSDWIDKITYNRGLVDLQFSILCNLHSNGLMSEAENNLFNDWCKTSRSELLLEPKEWLNVENHIACSKMIAECAMNFYKQTMNKVFSLE